MKRGSGPWLLDKDVKLNCGIDFSLNKVNEINLIFLKNSVEVSKKWEKV